MIHLRVTTLLAAALLLASCGGDGGGNGGDGDGADQGSSSDGTRLFSISAVGDGITLVDLDQDEEEQFVEGLTEPHHLTLLNGSLWFAEGSYDLVWVDPGSGDEEGRAALPAHVSDLAVTDDTAWVISGIIGGGETLVAVDLDEQSVRGSLMPPEGTRYDFVAASGDDVWVFGGDPMLATVASRIDPVGVTQELTVDTGLIGDSMVIGAGALWVGGTIPGAVPMSGLAKLDTATGEVIQLIELGDPADHITVATAFGHVWLTEGLKGILYKIDPETGEIISQGSVGAGAAGIPLEILETEDLIWIFNTTEDEARGFDPETLEFESGIRVPPFASAPVFAP